jgi:hypothetical protein
MYEETYVDFDESPSPLDVLERSFELLIDGPCPLAVNGRKLGHGLPARLVTVGELRVLLPGLTREGRDVAWRELLRLARTGAENWMVMCAGLALPGLRKAAGRVVRGYDCRSEDTDAEVVAGFVEAARTLDPNLPDVCGRLCQAAYNAGRRARWAEVAYSAHHVVDEEMPEAMAPPAPVSHPDVVLRRAVIEGALTEMEAELIGRVHLENRPIHKVAGELGLPRTTAQDALKRAKERLVEWLGVRSE